MPILATKQENLYKNDGLSNNVEAIQYMYMHY